ncbi:MAG: cupin domain-containing protein [Armatimonadetes bacterium]|nr:cupin domain-containing protein [Armatimonadota bacterium]
MSECKVVQNGSAFSGVQGLEYFAGVSAESAGSAGICMHIVDIPAGARANAHYHADHETAIYVLDGEVEMLYGANLEKHLVVRKDEFLYIPAGMPHLPFNSTGEPARAVLARTDPNEQESVVLCPELEPKGL